MRAEQSGADTLEPYRGQVTMSRREKVGEMNEQQASISFPCQEHKGKHIKNHFRKALGSLKTVPGRPFH